MGIQNLKRPNRDMQINFQNHDVIARTQYG